MRKIYSLALAAIVAFSASAFDLKERPLRQLDSQKTEQAKKAKKDGLRVITSMKKISNKKITDSDIIKAPVTEDKALSASDLEGDWVFTMGDYYFQSSVGSTDVEYEAIVQGNVIIFQSASDNPFIGTVDVANSQVIFEKESLGTSSGYYVYQNPFYYDWDIEDLVMIDALIGDYDPDTMTLTFNAEHGIAWEAYTNANGFGNPAGYFGIYDFEGAYQGSLPEPDPIDEIQEGKWETVGMATFVDAWILPSYSMGGAQINPNNYSYEVELQKNVDDENIYRLWKPYKSAGALVYEQGLNQSKFDGQIVFNVSDPNYVEVVCTGLPAGFKNNNGEFYMSNELGWYIANGFDKDLVVSVLYEGEAADTYQTMTEADINAMLGVNAFDGVNARKVIKINTQMFDFSPACDEGYSWNNNPYSAYIIFPVEPVDDIQGNMVASLDMNMGMFDEPDLDEPKEYIVTASYNPATTTLTIYNFADLNPITFNVDLATGKAVAEGEQISSIDNGDPDYAFEYYYANLATKNYGVSANIYPVNDQTVIYVDPWGEALPDYDFFFGFAFYNTVVTLDYAIPGLESVHPTIKVEEDVEVIAASDSDNTAVVTVSVSSLGLPADADVTLYYHLENFHGEDEFLAAEKLVDEVAAVSEASVTRHTFVLNEINPLENNTLKLYAVAGVFKSDVIEHSFKLSDTSSIIEIGADNNAPVEYFNLQGVRIDNPAAGQIVIKKQGAEVSKQIIR